MLVLDKEKETFEESTVLPWGNSCSDKETGALWQKVVVIIGIQIPVLLIYTFR
jgi:hypothetical protein